VLRDILGRYLGVPPSELGFRYSAYGKPALAAGFDGVGVRFNISHSHEMALLAVTCHREIGVDIEYLGREIRGEEIAEHFFSTHERASLRALPAAAKHEAFFNCWTRKEAYIKAHGEGLSLPLDQFDVSLAPGEPAALLATRSDPREALRWSAGTHLGQAMSRPWRWRAKAVAHLLALEHPIVNRGEQEDTAISTDGRRMTARILVISLLLSIIGLSTVTLGQQPSSPLVRSGKTPPARFPIGQMMAGFRVVAHYTSHTERVVGLRMTHQATGLPLHFLWMDTAPQAAIMIRTYPDADHGAAHALSISYSAKAPRGARSRHWPTCLAASRRVRPSATLNTISHWQWYDILL
jgi:phosphopantetheine--protein transferase-like protein